jgi:hypothetical protein
VQIDVAARTCGSSDMCMGFRCHDTGGRLAMPHRISHGVGDTADRLARRGSAVEGCG